MNRILGESGTAATFYHLGLKMGSFDPEELHDKLTDMFHAGAPSIEKVITMELYKALDVQLKERREYDFVRHVGLAKKIYNSKIR
jgi:hypothetical protein